jgi:hypothetical protein
MGPNADHAEEIGWFDIGATGDPGVTDDRRKIAR